MSTAMKRARLASGASTGFLLLGVCAAAALPVLASSPGPAGDPPVQPVPQEAQVLDRIGGSYVNLATAPIRPMVYAPGENLWAINHHDSTIERFAGVNPDPLDVYGVPWGPVAIGYWPGDAGHDPELLVVCAGTWCVVGIDPADGRIVRVHQLRPGAALPGGLNSRIGRMATPGDLLIDSTNHRAFVSCGAADSVVQIDLANDAIVRVFHEEADPAFRCKTPTFLSWDHNGEDVLVAPLHSGNNTRGQSSGPGSLTTSTTVEDLSTWTQGLPDEDLFRVKPYVNGANPGSVEVVATGVGTMLFAHGLNPSTDEFWQLNTEALNALPNPQNEPDLNGQFLDNRVTILSSTSGTTWSGAGHHLLDIGGLGGSVTAAETVGQPYGLSFTPSGYGFLTGLLSDNVLVMDSAGGYHMEWDLPDGSIPRGTVFHPTHGNVVLVYCWGTNEVRAYTTNLTAKTVNLRHVYQLNHDPTPAQVAAGRELFFDGFFSEEGNLSCASCHIEMGNDMLTWNLSNHPQEQKGPMVTQLLIGLERLAPFHWRGERQLVDFNEAFTGLLGAPRKLDDAEFAQFQEFIFSLRNPANPNANRQRLLDASIHHPPTMYNEPTDPPHLQANHANMTGNAIDGEKEFQDHLVAQVGNHSCEDCHQFPTGTSNTTNVEQDSGRIPRRNTMKPAPFHELWRKKQSLVLVRETPTDQEMVSAFLGSGIAHLGNFADVFRFDDVIITAGMDQAANNISDLIHQWDQGIPLSAHYAFHLDANTLVGDFNAEIGGYLHGEMTKDNCDIAVIGQVADAQGALFNRRWAWDRKVGAYVCEDPAFANRQLVDFRNGVVNGESNVFLGMPMGMPDRWAVDYDMDGALNMAANEVGFEYDATVPNIGGGMGPSFITPPAKVWVSPRVARITFTTDEPTTASVAYSDPLLGPQPPVVVSERSRFHSVLLRDLRPSTSLVYGSGLSTETVTYAVDVTVFDLQGNPLPASTLQVTTDNFIEPSGQVQSSPEERMIRTHVVEKICMDGTAGTCDEWSVQGNGHLRFKVDLTTSFLRGMWQTPSGGAVPEQVRAPKRTVVGRVMIRKGGFVETADFHNLTVTPDAASTAAAQQVQILGPGVNQTIGGVPAPAGTYLVATTLTDSNGDTYIQFDVDPASGTGLAPGDSVIFNVEAVLEADDTGPAAPIRIVGTTAVIRVFWRGAFTQWSFPDTKEARSAIESAPL